MLLPLLLFADTPTQNLGPSYSLLPAPSSWIFMISLTNHDKGRILRLSACEYKMCVKLASHSHTHIHGKPTETKPDFSESGSL